MNGKESVRMAVLAIAAGVLMALPAMASGAVLYDQTSAGSGQGVFSIADDFTVPAGQSWTIQSVFADGINDLNALNIGAMTVHLYATAGSTPGAQLFAAQGVIPVQGPADDYAVPTVGAPPLGPGTYWVSVQANVDYPSQIWDWSTRTVLSGSPAVIDTPVVAGCTRWTVRGSLVPLPCPTAQGGPDQLFRLDGVSTPVTQHKKKCKKKKKGKKRAAEAKKKKCKKKKKKH
jgi:hypothetical protein